MRSLDYFATHPVFTAGEFTKAHTATGKSPHTSRNLLVKHVAAGRLLRVRRGLYVSVPWGVDPSRHHVDPYLVATALCHDAVVSLHGALQFHGKAKSIWRRYHYFTARRHRPLNFRGFQFVPVQVPASQRAKPMLGGGVEEVLHAGGKVRVTTLERTMVDVLASPELAGGWGEVWRSLEMVEYVDLRKVTAYALRHGTALAVARVGLFLEFYREQLMVEDSHLEPLLGRVPAQPRYLDAQRQPGRLVHPWNLIVPDRYLLEEADSPF